jgi:Rrf2 family protein
MAYSTAFSQAISIVIYIYFKTAEGMYDYLSTKAIAEKLNIPVPTAVKVIRRLTSAGLVCSKEGAKGGIILNQNIEDITLYDVFHAVENGNPLFKRHTEFKVTNDQIDLLKVRVLHTLDDAEEAMHESLRKVRLIDFLKDMI